MSMDNSINALQAPGTTNANFQSVNAEIKAMESGSNTPVNLGEHPALYLIEKFCQAISKIYKDMGIGNNIDYKA